MFVWVSTYYIECSFLRWYHKSNLVFFFSFIFFSFFCCFLEQRKYLSYQPTIQNDRLIRFHFTFQQSSILFIVLEMKSIGSIPSNNLLCVCVCVVFVPMESLLSSYSNVMWCYLVIHKIFHLISMKTVLSLISFYRAFHMITVRSKFSNKKTQALH